MQGFVPRSSETRLPFHFFYQPVADNPHAAVAAGTKALDVAAKDRRVVGLQPAPGEHGEFAAAGDPQFSVPVARHFRDAVRVGQRARCPVARAQQRAFLVQHPDVARVIRADGGNFPAHAGFVNGLRFKLSVAIACQIAALVADPQNAVCILGQARNAVALQPRLSRAVENGEARPIEPRQPAVSAQPQIAVVRLHHRCHRVVRQAVVRFPRAQKIIRQTRFRRAGSGQQQKPVEVEKCPRKNPAQP